MVDWSPMCHFPINAVRYSHSEYIVPIEKPTLYLSSFLITLCFEAYKPERIDALLDKDADRIEVGAFAGEGMYAEYGGCPSGGVVVVIGYISGKECIVVANDATVKAGAWFPITGKKNLRAQEIAIENRLPIIYLVDSAGVFLPMQDDLG